MSPLVYPNEKKIFEEFKFGVSCCNFACVVCVGVGLEVFGCMGILVVVVLSVTRLALNVALFTGKTAMFSFNIHVLCLVWERRVEGGAF